MKQSSLTQIKPEELQQEILKVFKELSKKVQLKSTDDYLTREEVAETLKVNKSTVSNWKRDGVLNAYGIGGRVYYKRSDIDEAMIKIN